MRTGKLARGQTSQNHSDILTPTLSMPNFRDFAEVFGRFLVDFDVGGDRRRDQ